MNKPLAFRRTHLNVALVAALAQMATGAAFAQTTPASTTQPSSAASAPAESTDAKIVVTGSRIKRDNYNSTSPVQIITNEESTLAGFASAAETLQGTAATGGTGQINNSFGGFVTDGGPGANTIGLRGFSPTRSLVLLNGRRITPSGTRGSVGAADLNVLPNAIVDHIEILKDGASSIYGSDAVAGVINIVTRKKVDGITVEGTHHFTDDGGGARTGLSIVGGKTGDRFNISGAFESMERDELTLGDREWTKCNTDYRRKVQADGSVGAWGSWDFVDPTTGKPKCYPITGTGTNGVTINTLGTTTRAGVGAPGSVGTSFNRWRPNAAVTTGFVGFEGVGGGTNNLNVRDTFEPRMLKKSLISPGRTDNLFIQGGYDLNALGDGELYFEVMGSRRESSQTGYRQLALDYMKGSPLLPASMSFSTFLPPQPITNGANVGVRAFIGFGNDHSSQKVDYLKATTGVRGNFIWSTWDYDFNVSHARSDGEYIFESFLTDRLAQSLNVVAAGAGFACKNPANGCVAAPALTPAVIGGQLPREWVDFVFRPVKGQTTYKESTATFGISGKLFKMPYGQARGAFGVEYRTAKIDDTPPPDSINGNLYNLTSATPTRGSDSVREAYGEIEIPLLAGLKGAEELTFNASARFTDYNSYGSDSTYKVGALWTPVKWATLRATQGTSYRAPALYEQFLGATSGFLSQQNDPCNNWDSASRAGTTRAKNCQSEGLPAGFTATSGIKVLTAGGADQGLAAETSKNMTIGLVLQPELPAQWGNFSFAVDYFDIKVDNGVSRMNTSDILRLCYDDPDFRAGGGFCRLIDPRVAGTNALTVHNAYVNLATDIVRGFDYTARYSANIGSGKLRANLNLTQFKEQSNKLFADDPLDDVNGTLTNPKFAAVFDTSYTYKEWTVRYGMEWVDGQSSYAYYEEDPKTSIYKLDVPDYYTHNLSLRYKGDKWEAVIGARNLTDKTPPVISSGITNRIGNAPLYSGYDYFGRTFFLNISKTF